jgi:hypothetical protein
MRQPPFFEEKPSSAHHRTDNRRLEWWRACPNSATILVYEAPNENMGANKLTHGQAAFGLLFIFCGINWSNNEKISIGINS